MIEQPGSYRFPVGPFLGRSLSEIILMDGGAEYLENWLFTKDNGPASNCIRAYFDELDERRRRSEIRERKDGSS